MASNSDEIRSLSTPEIKGRLDDAREELMRLRFQQATGELTDFTRLRQTRRRIARILTILGERERMDSMEGEE
jgi:large subunit ribosomal protein L29